MTTTLKITICAARDGGLAVWIDGQAEPVFAGDDQAFGKYIHERAKGLMSAVAKQKSNDAEHQSLPLKVVPARPLTPRVLADQLVEETA